MIIDICLQLEMHAVELLVRDPSPFHVKIAVANLKKYKSQIPVELIQEECETLLYVFHKLINYI
jgi:hypothetical protein